MHPTVRFVLPDGDTRELHPGDLIGRLASAALHLDDERVSEAHALVSLRGRSLQLLGLRGRFVVDQKPTSTVTLVPGLEIELARDLFLGVEDVELPASVLALEGDELPRQVLSGVCSLLLEPRPRLVTRWRSDAAAWLFSTGSEWRLRLPGVAPQPIGPGDAFTIEGGSFRCVPTAIEAAAQSPTRVGSGAYRPLRIEARFDTAHIHRPGEEALILSGLSARILSELVAFDGPVNWEVIAGEIWPADEGDTPLRSRWDTNLMRLRRKLRDAHVRSDLVRSDRRGQVELVLYEGDRVEDRT